MKIGIFGGTFNPIHKGHMNMINNVKKELNLDIIYFVPSYKTPDKQFQIEKISPINRFEMVNKVIDEENKSWLKVSDFEFKEKKISYTYKTIEYFKNKYPNDKLYWIMGEDRYRGFDKWKNSEYIRKNAKIIIYRRAEKINQIISEDKSVTYLKKDFFDISSTYILSHARWDLLPDAAKEYICKNKIYLKTLVFEMLKKNRYEHSVAVASHAKRLSKEYKFKNAEKALLTGLVHDLFKSHSNEELLEYKKIRGKEFTNEDIPLPALHGFIVALWIRDEYGWDDKEVFDALASHTLGKSNAKKLDKIIFVADKISSDRKGHKTGKLRKLAYSNLELTYNKILKSTINKLKRKKIEPHPTTIEAYRQSVQPIFRGDKYKFELKKNRKKIK